jgi:hypothetical protein
MLLMMLGLLNVAGAFIYTPSDLISIEYSTAYVASVIHDINR